MKTSKRPLREIALLLIYAQMKNILIDYSELVEQNRSPTTKLQKDWQDIQ